MLSGVFLFLRRWQEIVLRIVVDHGLGQDLVVIVTLGRRKLLVHEGSNLIHI